MNTPRRARQCLVVLAGLTIPVATATAAAADTNPDYTAVPPTTAPKPPTKVHHSASRPAAPAPRSSSSSRDSLPITGGDVAQLTVVGAALLAGGGLVLRARKLATR